MKKFAIILSILSVSFFSISAFAEEPMDLGMNAETQETPQQQDGPRDHQEGDKRKMSGKKMMGGMMQQSSMVASSDGGVIVLSGHKLTKYDANLKVVKEIELKGGPSPDKMQDKMHWKQMPESGASENPPAEAPAAAEAAWEVPSGEAQPVGQ